MIFKFKVQIDKLNSVTKSCLRTTSKLIVDTLIGNRVPNRDDGWYQTAIFVVHVDS